MKNYQIEVSPSPIGLTKIYDSIFTDDCLKFLSELYKEFEDKITQLHLDRAYKKYKLRKTKEFPKFTRKTAEEWKVSPIPKRLQNRHLDIGDVSPSLTNSFVNALKQNVQGIQVDFDDGHCPTWHNQILGLYNVKWVVQERTAKLRDLPVMMLRPRAWNMTEHNVIVDGRKLPGPVVDFSLLMYHNAKILHENDSGPYFYLSKLEGASEACLWNEIFVWAEKKLNLPLGAIKSCVLIENILAAYEMDEILYELRENCIGLNCGIWDYSASIIAKFGWDKNFVLPDRKKYVNMQKHFLKKYMRLLIQTCHKRGALATGGMAAVLTRNQFDSTVKNAVELKKFEIEEGIDGFMVYDVNLIEPMNNLWKELTANSPNQINYIPKDVVVEKDLLLLPKGKVTWDGFVHNVEITILFIYNWMKGMGTFNYKGFVEDSATAEISRSQIWQWIRHEANIEEKYLITPKLVSGIINDFIEENRHLNHHNLLASCKIAMDLFTSVEFPDFITTYLNDHFVMKMEEIYIKNKL